MSICGKHNFTRLLIPLCMLLALSASSAVPCALAQSASTPPAPPVRDPVAVQALQSSLQAMGGQAAWAAIHSAKTQGTQTGTRPGDPESHFTWEDDWSMGVLRFRYERDDSSGSHIRTHDPFKGSFSQEGSATTPLPAPVDIGAMPIHLPGAMLAMILADNSYEIAEKANNNKDFPGDTCIGVVQTHNGVRVELTRQEWFINAATQLPDEVNTREVDTMRPNTPAKERVKYPHFSSASQVLFPDQMEIVVGHVSELFSMNQPEYNAPIPASDF